MNFRINVLSLGRKRKNNRNLPLGAVVSLNGNERLSSFFKQLVISIFVIYNLQFSIVCNIFLKILFTRKDLMIFYFFCSDSMIGEIEITKKGADFIMYTGRSVSLIIYIWFNSLSFSFNFLASFSIEVFSFRVHLNDSFSCSPFFFVPYQVLQWVVFYLFLFFLYKTLETN